MVLLNIIHQIGKGFWEEKRVEQTLPATLTVLAPLNHRDIYSPRPQRNLSSVLRKKRQRRKDFCLRTEALVINEGEMTAHFAHFGPSNNLGH